MSVSIHIRRNNTSITSDDGQHLSRLTDYEVRDLVLQILVFHPDVRKEVWDWVKKGDVEKISDYLCPEVRP